MSKLVTWASPVGGAGTTTAVWHMAHVATSAREPILAVDLSPSTTLSHLAGIDGGPGLADVIDGDIDLQAAIHRTDVGGLHILPGGDIHETRLVEAISNGTLHGLLSSLSQGPHPVFLDLPAGFSALYSLAAGLSQWVLLAVPCKKEAIVRLPKMIQPLLSGAGRTAAVGLVISRFEAWSKVQSEQYRILRKILPGSALWRTVIPFDDVFDEAMGTGLPATMSEPDSSGSRAFFDLFGEWMARRALIEMAGAQQNGELRLSQEHHGLGETIDD